MFNRNHPGGVKVAARSAVRLLIKRRGAAQGQAMVEYVLIAVLVAIAIAGVITATGPAVGNIFSNTVYNLLGQKFTPASTYSRSTIEGYATILSQFSPPPADYGTNTPAAPTCSPPSSGYAPSMPPPAPPGTFVLANCT
jgi:Flp pilus assembly pilin Flp